MHRHPPAPASLVLYLVAAALVLSGPGCGANAPMSDRAIRAPYPADAPYGPDLDVVVVRDRTGIELVNREPRAFGPGQLWLNGAYMRPIDRIEIGTGNHLDLAGFHNAYGEHYPTGTFLRPDRSFRLVLAEFYDPEAKVRHRLTVRPEKHPRTN